MNERFRAFWRSRIVWIFILIYATIWALQAYIARWGVHGIIPNDELLAKDAPAALGPLRLLVLVVFAAGFGFVRPWSHPRADSSYATWLAVSPWRYGSRLPCGAVLPQWDDLAVWGGLTLATMLEPRGFYWGLFAIVGGSVLTLMMAGYALAGLLLLRRVGQGMTAAAMLFIIPLLWYPLRPIWLAVAVAPVCFLLVVWALRRSLLAFPWDTPLWKPPTLREQALKAAAAGVLGGGYAHTLPEPVEPTMPGHKLWIGALLFAWHLHVWIAVGRAWNWNTAFPWVFALGAVGIAFLVRSASYHGGFRSLLTFRARLWLLRPIIPGYDHAVLATWAVLLLPLALLWLMWRAGIERELSAPLTGAAGILLAGILPPHLHAWRLTGRHRVNLTQKPLLTSNEKDDE